MRIRRRQARRRVIRIAVPAIPRAALVTIYVPGQRSPEEHLASARERAGLQDCCWKKLLQEVRPVTRPLEQTGLVFRVGRFWPSGSVSYEQAYQDIQKEPFGGLAPCEWRLLLASRILHSDLPPGSFLWTRRLVLMTLPIICEGCHSQMRCSVCSRADDTFEATICVSKTPPILPESAYVFGVFNGHPR